MSGNPSAEAKRFLEETTGADRPRVNRNAVVLAVSSPDGLELARAKIRDYLGWEEVRTRLTGQPLDAARKQMLDGYTEKAQKEIPDAIEQAYSIVVTIGAKNEVEAFK